MKVLRNGKAVEMPVEMPDHSEQASRMLMDAADFFAATLAQADPRAWEALLTYIPAERDRLASENETLVSGMTQLAERAVASSTVALAEIDHLRTFVRSARGIVQAYASEHPKLVCQGSYQGDPMGAHAWLAAEAAEVGTNRDGGDPKVEKRT